ncbi:MAG: cell wall-binding repeat-containing protein [Ruminococcus sp.]|nr:cell wall-binding repeat-containing protein [Ruminococcus sp.]
MKGITRKIARFFVSFALTACAAVSVAICASAYDAKTNLLKQYEQTKNTGIVNVGISGSFIDDINNAINRVNAIRKEACDQGVWDPRNSSRKLTSSDYVPIQWSHELEEVARLRAAEASMTISHTRPNGKSCFTVSSTVSSGSEVLAWNYSKTMVNGINQFYGEKSDWVNKTSGAVTGHYTSMINPNNKYMGLGCFYATSKVPYPNTLCGRFSTSTKTSTKGSAVSNCYVPVQVTTSSLTNGRLKCVSGSSTIEAGKTASYELWADASYRTNTNVLLYEANWKSSNTAVATVDKYGKVTGVKTGSAVITATCGGISKSVTVTVKQYPPSTRISGKNRFATSVEISKATYTKADTVVIASGMDFADALCSVSLANAYKAPILLVTKDTVGDDVLGEIKRLGAKTAMIIGGTGVVGTSVESKLKSAGLNTERIAGKTRFETAVLSAQRLKDKGYAPKSLFIVYYNSYADALSASNVAAMLNAPILYVKTTGDIDSTTKQYLSAVKSSVANVYVIGGTGVISEQMSNTIKAYMGKTPVRVAGQNRYETCVEINKKFASTITSRNLCIATGQDFPDALAGGVYSATNGTALFLADVSLNSAQTAYLKSKAAEKLIVFGGDGPVPNAMIQKIKQNSV